MEKESGDSSVKVRKANRRADEDFIEEEVVGEQTAVAAFNAALIVPPTSPPPVNTNVPKSMYLPYYAYGYRGFDSRQNIFFTAEGKLAYPMAALGILLDPAKNTQTFFGGNALGKSTNQHDDDILCLAISSDRKKVATGQTGVKPKLFIWKADTGTYAAKYILTGKNSKGIVSCAFSPDNEYVALSDLSSEHILYVVNANNGKLLWKKETGKSVIYGIAWSSGKDFATCGAKYVQFWNVDTQEAKEGTGIDPDIMSCVAFDGEGHCHASSIKGKIYVFDGMNVHKKLDVHKGKVNSLVIYDKTLVSSGDDNRVVIMKTESYDILYEISCRSIPRAADILDNQVVVGDITNGITLYKDGKEVDTWLGHHEGELWGLDIADDHIITSGDDNKIIVWDSMKCKAISMATINDKAGEKLKDNFNTKSKLPDNQCARSISYNPVTKEVAIAVCSGQIHIRDIADIAKDKLVIDCSKRWIECMHYSPNGDMLAVGTHANELVIYALPSYSIQTKITQHSTPVICVDWTPDQQYLRSLDEGFDMLFWKVADMKQDPNGANSTKDMEWHTQSCKIGWSVQGIYPPGVDKSHVNEVAKSKDGKLIATGDDWGFVNIYNYPCGKKAKCTSLRGHSEQVPRIEFSKDDAFIFSVGGDDKTIIQWKRK